MLLILIVEGLKQEGEVLENYEKEVVGMEIPIYKITARKEI